MLLSNQLIIISGYSAFIGLCHLIYLKIAIFVGPAAWIAKNCREKKKEIIGDLINVTAVAVSSCFSFRVIGNEPMICTV